MHLLTRSALVFAFALGAALPLAHGTAQETARPAIKEYNLDKKSVALQGYDPVAYFSEGGAKPKKGTKDIKFAHRGVTYRFANEANRKLFQATPERFEPAYGGWCAYAMSQGDKVEVDPKSFLIQNDRLMVFYDGFLSDTRKKWKKGDRSKLENEANKTWKKLSGETPPRDTSAFNLDANGVGLKGYDPTSYTANGATPKPGSGETTALYDGVTYRFANDEARKRFLATPASLEPAYGGWCAYAMSLGKKIDIDPTAFLVTEAGLLVFKNASARDAWQSGNSDLRSKADTNWKRILGDG